MSSHRAVESVALCLLLAGSSAFAQNDIPVAFEFSFSNPGARSMGFGGAFVALADDATAAFANPAGLVQLVEPEVSVETRSWSYSTPYVAGGRIFGEPSGIGLDNSPGLRWDESSAHLAGLSYFSFVQPMRRWSLALYHHQLANFESSGAIQGIYSGPWPGGVEIRREFDQRRSTRLEIASHGAAAAFQVSADLSIGLSVAYYEGQARAVTELFLTAEQNRGPLAFFEPMPPLPENLLSAASLTIDDADWALAGGILWRVHRQWRLGGFYREAPQLRAESRRTLGATNLLGLPAGTTLIAPAATVHFPDVYGLGASYRSPNERLTVALEWDHVSYSDLVRYFRIGGLDNRLDDADELRLGAEYVFLGSRPVFAVRAGAWIDPGHRIYNPQHYLTEALFPPAEDELHLAAGLGVVLRSMQIDAAVDLSEVVNTASLSAVYSF